MPNRTPSRHKAVRRRVAKPTMRRSSSRRARPVKRAPASKPAAARGRRPVPATPAAGRGTNGARSGGKRAKVGKPLTRREVNEFRRLLEAERDRLTQELEAMEEHLPEVEQVSMDTSGSYDEDLVDVASDAFEREKGFALENNVQELLNQVEEALSRMDDGLYGLCEVCGQSIHPERLRALPYARLCIDCKAREEQTISR